MDFALTTNRWPVGTSGAESNVPGVEMGDRARDGELDPERLNFSLSSLNQLELPEASDAGRSRSDSGEKGEVSSSGSSRMAPEIVPANPFDLKNQYSLKSGLGNFRLLTVPFRGGVPLRRGYGGGAWVGEGWSTGRPRNSATGSCCRQ